jgi:hypothetical protein
VTGKGCVLSALLWVCSVSLAGQSGPAVVNLTVKVNGKEEKLPDAVMVSYDGHSLRLPIQDGHFEVPPEVLRKEKVTFWMTVGADKIRIVDVHGGKFGNEKWTLILEDHRFGAEFQPMLKGAKVRSSCVVVFESKTAEGTALIDSHCRSKSP